MYIYCTILVSISLFFLQTVVGDEYFYCMDGSPIPYDNVCDGIEQCADASDEDGDICATTDFECSNGQIIDIEGICNGTTECVDGSDESLEKCILNKCEEKMFRCKYGGCIDPELVCDKRTDCRDGSDEREDLCSDDNKCVIPKEPLHTSFNISECSDCSPGTEVKSGTKMTVHCHFGYTLHTKHNVAICQGGNWRPEVGKCYQTEMIHLGPRLLPIGSCPPIKVHAGITVECKKGRKEVACNSPLPSGAVAKFSCNNYYELEGEGRAKCLPNGQWSKAVRCKSSCYQGKEIALIVKGQLANSPKSFPWVAGLYAVENEEWTYRCGGTLISDNAIITAAHCVWELTASDLKVTLGKMYRDYYKKEKSQQYFDIKEVKVLSVYQDSNGNYGSDLAVLFFKTRAQLSNNVHPACIQWDEDLSDRIASSGRKGIVAGWGLTEQDKPSDILRYISIPVINNRKCILNEPFDFRKFVTFTSFCAGYNNGTSVCNGDSGSGLLFYDNSSLYLEGIVSVSPRKTNSFTCEPKLYTIFTKVNIYKRWLKKLLQRKELD